MTYTFLVISNIHILECEYSHFRMWILIWPNKRPNLFLMERRWRQVLAFLFCGCGLDKVGGITYPRSNGTGGLTHISIQVADSLASGPY